MEAVRKPKARERQRDATPSTSTSAPVREAPAAPSTALSRALPDVPVDDPGIAPPIPPRVSPPDQRHRQERERSPSPEPEVIEIPPEVEREPPPPPPLPPRYIFPRTNGTAAVKETRSTPSPSVEAPPLPEKTRLAPAATADPVPRVSIGEGAVPSMRTPAYPTLDTMPEASTAGLPWYAELSREATSVMEKSREVAAAATGWTPMAPMEEAPPLYPAIGILDITDTGLLTENTLLSFYHNALYEASDDIVDRFCAEEESPNGPIYSLLARFKAVCDDIALSAVEESANAAALSKCLREVWMMQERTHTHQDHCGENRAGSGIAKYEIATLSAEKLEQMRKLLSTNRAVTLIKRMCQEVQARSLALQIQWVVISINTSFFAEHGVAAGTPPTLLPSASLGMQSSRLRLRAALSDIFAHLRLPQLPKRFSDAATAWATELVCVLQRSMVASDGVWLLLHILRLPSPSAQWTAPMLQTFTQAAAPGKLKVDFCISLLAQIMSPIRARSSFLSAVSASHAAEVGDQWMILDDEGEHEHDPLLISEADLASLLEQLPISDFYSTAFLHFSQTNPDRQSQFISLIAFQLLLMKILSAGLETYASLEYKGFVKAIGMYLRKSVRELAAHWRATRGLLDPRSEAQMQKEMDRVLLLGVQYIVSQKKLGLWQYLVDLPFDAISDECRIRVEYLLRNAGDPSAKTVRDLFETPVEEVTRAIQPGSLGEKLEAAASDPDTVFLVTALAGLVASSARDPTPFLREIVQTCFVDAAMRDSLYKVGGEAIGTVLSARPVALEPLLTIIDRNLDHMEEHAVAIFASAPLHLCRLNEGVIGGVIGKWLIARAPDRAGNRVARKVLAALNWGYEDERGDRLWMSERAHAICADTVLKAHIAHCTRSNGMIAKGVKQLAKLASKIPDYEQQFNQFCWDLLVKLKLKIEPSSNSPAADLAAYFVHAAQHSLASPEEFAEKGLGYVQELINAGCTSAAVILMTRAFRVHCHRMEPILGHKNFVAVFESVLRSDQCSYAYQLLAGPSSSPTPIVRLICCAIVFDARLAPDLRSYLRAWVDALCARRIATFNSDQVTLQILGTIARLAFERDPKGLLGIPDLLTNVYAQQLTAWRESSKGFLSMFSGTPTPPPFIASTYLPVSAWSAFLLLLVEEDAHSSFQAALYEALAKKDKTTLEEAIKKATSKVSFTLLVERLPLFRWMELVRACGTGGRASEAERDAPVLTLALQRMALQMFTKRSSMGKSHQLCRRYMSASAAPMWRGFEEFLTSRPPTESRGLAKALMGWTKATTDIALPSFSDFARFDLDYLLQLAIAGDKNVWLDYVDINVLTAQDTEDSRIYAHAVHERGRPLPPPPRTSPTEGIGLSALAGTRALPFPVLPTHPNLPPAPVLDRSMAVQPAIATGMVQPFLASISKLAIQFTTSSDMSEDKDREYCELLKKLYGPAVKNLAVVVKCGAKCNIPVQRTTQVSGTEFNTTTDAAMTRNREERSANVSGLQHAVLDPAAVQTASIEFISREMANLAAGAPANLRQGTLQQCGRSLFYLITSSVAAVDSSPILFPPATASLEQSLRTLGKAETTAFGDGLRLPEFISGRPEEQPLIMKLVLDGFVLSSPLVEAFSPECLSPQSMVRVYSDLSDAVAKPELSPRALLLLSRLSISKATALPAAQFRPLMPLAFRNVTSSAAGGDVASPLGQLCLSHFVAFIFHQFPYNFVYGLELTLEGCNAGSTPPALLETIARRVDASNAQGRLAEHKMDAKTSSECIDVSARALSTARSSSGMASLFTRWQKYTDSLGALFQLFTLRCSEASFNAESPPSLLERELAESFGRATSLFGPLIAPAQPSLPPFSPSSEESANALLTRFVATASALPHNAALPPASQNVLSLTWRFYAEQLATLTHGTQYYYSALESHLVRLPWPQFWPSFRALQAMDDVLSSRSADCAPFVSQIVVRIPWKDVLASHVPPDLLPSYLSTLFLVLVRLIAKQGNVAKVRASMTELLKYLAARPDWPSVSVDDAERIAQAVAVVLPFDTLSNPTEGVSVLQVIWRRMCSFSSSRGAPADGATILKQCAFLRAELQLAIRTGSPSAALPAYNRLISDASTVAASQDNLRTFCPVARELTAAWTRISDVKMGEALVTGLQSYLTTCPTSPLVLTTLNTIVASLNIDQHSTALRVMETTLGAYFKRPTSSWVEAAQWTFFPDGCRDRAAKYLLCLPNSENKLVPLPLALRAFLIHGEASAVLYEKLLYYITNIKPKYVEAEAEFIAILSLLLQWLASPSTPSDSATTGYRTLIEWLKRVAHDERGGGFFGAIGLGKKNAYSAKMRLALQLLELFIIQQRLSGEKSPELRMRRQENTPVLNSRIAALKELGAVKANLPHGAAFSLATPFFTRVESFHLGHAHLLLQKVASSIFGNPRFLET